MEGGGTYRTQIDDDEAGGLEMSKYKNNTSSTKTNNGMQYLGGS